MRERKEKPISMMTDVKINAEACINAEYKINANERIDDLCRDNLKLIQNTDVFCFGMDAVLLSSFAALRNKDTVMDLCTGTGILPILLSAKTKAVHIDALEVQKESAEMARRSIILNELSNRITIYEGDVKTASDQFGKNCYDAVTVNPPYMNQGHGLKNPNMPMAIARHEILCTLEDVIRESANLLKPKGRFYMVHRPFRLAEIFVIMNSYRLEPKRMQLVYPFADKEPNMVLIEGVKDGNPMLKITPPLIVYRPDGTYTDELLALYGMTRK